MGIKKSFVASKALVRFKALTLPESISKYTVSPGAHIDPLWVLKIHVRFGKWYNSLTIRFPPLGSSINRKLGYLDINFASSPYFRRKSMSPKMYGYRIFIFVKISLLGVSVPGLNSLVVRIRLLVLTRIRQPFISS